jgi:hypothetical protein
LNNRIALSADRLAAFLDLNRRILHPIPKTYVLSKVANTAKNNRGYEPFAETDRLGSILAIQAVGGRLVYIRVLSCPKKRGGATFVFAACH